MVRFLLALVVLLTAVPPLLAQPKVSAVRIGEHSDKVRFVMEMSEPPRYRVFTLPDPFRVVIDLPELAWETGAKEFRATGTITAMRFGLFAPGTSRVVLDMAGPIRIRKVFVLPPREAYPHRFVVDVVPVSRAEFFADAQRRPVVSATPLEPLRAAVIAPPKPKTDTRPTIVIDPGHGGIDPGARSVTGYYEKSLTLAYARALKKQLEASGRYRVALTRDKDIFLRLRDRVGLAQKLGGDLFVSLHANNHDSPRIRGFSVYTLSENGSDAEAEAIAAKENKADILAGVDLGDQTEVVGKILIDLAQRETMNLSKQFANTLVGEVRDVTRMLGNSHRSAGFVVLKSPVVPSVLIEVGYLSNKAEERNLRSAKHRTKVTAKMVEAIDAYFAWQDRVNRS